MCVFYVESDSRAWRLSVGNDGATFASVKYWTGERGYTFTPLTGKEARA